MMDKVSVGCIVYLIVVFERLQNHLKIYVNKIENVTYVSIYIINIIRKNVNGSVMLCSSSGLIHFALSLAEYLCQYFL